MDIEAFLSQNELINIGERLYKIKEAVEQNRFNLFSLSSYNAYLENFHSDLIAVLLNPDDAHNHNDIFLKLFLEYLIGLGVKLNKEDYALCEVTREKGRIDIWIKDNTSRKSIVIENKINNAADQEDQLYNYYKYAKNCGFDVDCIVYLTLRGNKRAPLTDVQDLNDCVINISAFTNSEGDLCNGWLTKCYNLSQDENCRSFIFQYQKLIKHLSQMGLNKQIKDDFYSIINKQDGYDKTKVIAELFAELEEYRADLFAERIGNNYQPFRKIYRWRPNHWLFEDFTDNGTTYKVDVHFHPDAVARIDFWNPHETEDIQKKNTSEKLRSIGLLDDFEFGGFGGGMYKVFNLKTYGNIKAVDDEMYNFLKSFFLKLRR